LALLEIVDEDELKMNNDGAPERWFSKLNQYKFHNQRLPSSRGE
jgi:hypothetical protein